VADAVNAAKVRSRWNKWVTQPKASYTLTAPSSATATQFHEMWDSAVLFIGGTLTNLSVSKDGTNFFTIATAANANGILWRFTSGDYYKITYTAAPTIRVFPVT
jgi:hypothetical protein